MKTLAACVVVVFPFLAGVCGEAPTGAFARPRALARNVPSTYAAICESYYGMGNYGRLLVARLDVRPDGTPNIVLDRDKGRAEFTVRLSVDEAAYGKWRVEATRRMKELWLSPRPSGFERPHKMRIAGADYYLGDNEAAALARLRNCPLKPAGSVSVRVTLVGSKGDAIRRIAIPLDKFARTGHDRFSLPLHHLNRLRDLPVEQFYRSDLERDDSGKNAVREDAYAMFSLDGLTETDLNRIKHMKCEVVQEAAKDWPGGK